MRMTSKYLSMLLCLCMALSGCESNPAVRATTAMDDATMKKIAEQFFIYLVEEKGEDALQEFEMIDAMRSWIQGGEYKAAINAGLQLSGGIGELRKKEIIQHDAQAKSVELFYSGTTNSFKIRVSFGENQIVGIHLLPWADE